MGLLRRATSCALLTLALTLLPSAAHAAAKPIAPTASTVPAPIVGIDSVDPIDGSTNGGFTITVTGVGFAPGQTTVRLCDIDIAPAGVQVNGAGNVLTFTAPPCATTGLTQLRVITPTGSAATVFYYEGEGALAVTGGAAWPVVTAGTALTIAGCLVLILTRRRTPRRGWR